MPIANVHARVLAHFQRTGSVLQGTARGECTGFEIILSLETTSEMEKVQQCLKMAHATCYTESALRGQVPIVITHMINGHPFQGNV